METNNLTIAIVAILIIVLIVFLILKNKKDKQKYIKEETKVDLPVEKHDGPKI